LYQFECWKRSTSVLSTLRQSVGPKGVFYNVSLEIKEAEILESLQPHVKFVKRLQYKPSGEMELCNSTTVLLHFKSELPSELNLGYLIFKPRQYIPKPLRCFKCNRFGHVANHCKGKERCSTCGEYRSWTACPSKALKCLYCHGNHSANDKICPRYKQEQQIKSLNTVTYAEAVKIHRGSGQSTASPNLWSRSEFPPLSTVDHSNH